MIVIDPVCKMEVETETAQWKSEHGDQTYHFCSPGCLRSFEKDPHNYLEAGHHEHQHDLDHH